MDEWNNNAESGHFIVFFQSQLCVRAVIQLFLHGRRLLQSNRALSPWPYNGRLNCDAHGCFLGKNLTLSVITQASCVLCVLRALLLSERERNTFTFAPVSNSAVRHCVSICCSNTNFEPTSFMLLTFWRTASLLLICALWMCGSTSVIKFRCDSALLFDRMKVNSKSFGC